MNSLIGMFSILIFLLLTDTVYRVITQERNYRLEKVKLKIEVAKIVLKGDFYRFKNKLIDNKDAFEVYCANLLKALDFENVQVTELVGDGGKDIIAYKDGEKYYVECKLWDWEIENNSVGRPVVQKLVGAMVKDRVKKGFIITTSYFTPEALEYASNLPEEIEIELIDGDKLIKLLEDLRQEWIPELINTLS